MKTFCKNVLARMPNQAKGHQLCTETLCNLIFPHHQVRKVGFFAEKYSFFIVLFDHFSQGSLDIISEFREYLIISTNVIVLTLPIPFTVVKDHVLCGVILSRKVYIPEKIRRIFLKIYYCSVQLRNFFIRSINIIF